MSTAYNAVWWNQPGVRNASVHARIGAEHPCRSACQPRVRLVSLPVSRLSTVASLSTTSAGYLRTNHSLSFLHSPRFPFLFIYILSLFFRTLGNHDQHLAAATRFQYAPNTIFGVFIPFLLTFSCSSGATTFRIPSP